MKFISGRARTSALDLILQLAMVLLSTGLTLYYGAQTHWTSAALALLNAGLLLYGIRCFIGFAKMRQDLVFSLSETLDYASRQDHWLFMPAKDRLFDGISSSVAWVNMVTQPVLRTRFFPWQVL